MDQRAHMIMVAASDIGAIRKFYEIGLGWTPWMEPRPGAVSYRVSGSILYFLDAGYQARESGLPMRAGMTDTILALFVESRDDVDRIFARALAAGAAATSPIRLRDRGIYSGYFTDPDGHPWEIVCDARLPFEADGALGLPPVSV